MTFIWLKAHSFHYLSTLYTGAYGIWFCVNDLQEYLQEGIRNNKILTVTSSVTFLLYLGDVNVFMWLYSQTCFWNAQVNLNKHCYQKELLKSSCARWISKRALWSILRSKSLWPHAGLSVCFTLHYAEIPAYKSCWQISFDINQIKSYKRFIVLVPKYRNGYGG